MRARLVATLSALVAVSLPFVHSSTADARPTHRGHAKAVLTLAAGAPTYTVDDRPVLTYTWLHKRKGDRLLLQQKRETGWTPGIRLPHTRKGHRGSGTVSLDPLRLGEYAYRVIVSSRGTPARSTAAETAFQVYGPVPIINLIRVTPSSNAVVDSGVVQIAGQPFPYTFERYLTGASIWRSVVDVPATSCRGIGIPLASRRRDDSTGGTFSMRAVSTSDVVMTANAAAPDSAAGLLAPVTVGARLAVQVMSDRDVDYFGAGQATCYTKDGRA
jgi:hypothetical protein